MIKYLLVEAKAARLAAAECEGNARDVEHEMPDVAEKLRSYWRALTPQSKGGEAIEVSAERDVEWGAALQKVTADFISPNEVK